MFTIEKMAGNKTTKVIKAVMPPIAEVFSFMLDLGAYLLKDPYAWKKPYTGYQKELVHEQSCEYAVIKDKKILICRKDFLVFAIRGKNRRQHEYRYTYRAPTEEDLAREDFKKQIDSLRSI
jgi:hypothetical protein